MCLYYELSNTGRRHTFQIYLPLTLPWVDTRPTEKNTKPGLKNSFSLPCSFHHHSTATVKVNFQLRFFDLLPRIYQTCYRFDRIASDLIRNEQLFSFVPKRNACPNNSNRRRFFVLITENQRAILNVLTLFPSLVTSLAMSTPETRLLYGIANTCLPAFALPVKLCTNLPLTLKRSNL